MNTRLQQFIAAENISQSQFADILGVARASVSHILAGRNKPGFDFIESIGRHFPSLNLEWLITGKGRMYKKGDMDDDSAKPSQPSPEAVAPEPLPVVIDVVPEAPVPAPTKSKAADDKPKASANKHTISKIIVFFDDNTYQELK